MKICRDLSDDTDGIMFILSFLLQFLASSTYLMSFATFLSTFIGFSTYLNSLIDDFNSISSRVEKGLMEKSKLKTQQIINEHIKFHYDIIR